MWKENILIGLIFVFFTILFTFPAILHLSDRIIGDGVDNYSSIGWQYVAKTQMDKGVFPFSWTNYWRYPTGFDFSRGYDSTLFIFVGLFIYKFNQDPIFVYNLSVLFLVFLNGILSYTFFEKISKKASIGILGSVIYSFSFYVLARLGGHVNLISVGCFPFFLYSLINFWEQKGDTKAHTLVGLSIVLIFFSSLQYFLIAIGTTIFFIPLFMFFYPEISIDFIHLVSKNIVRGSITFLICLLFFLIFNSGHLSSFFDGSLITLPKGYMSYLSPHLVNFYLPNTYNKILTNSLNLPKTDLGSIEGAFYIGAPEILVFIIFLVSKIKKKQKYFLLVTISVVFLLSLGCSNPFMPYCYLYNIFPFEGIAEVGRLYVVLYLFITTAIIITLAKLPKSLSWVLVVFVGLVVFERLPYNFYLSSTHAQENFIQVVKKLDSNAVLDLPIVGNWTGTKLKNTYDLYSVLYQKPIVGGAFHWLGETRSSELFVKNFEPLQCGTVARIDDLNDVRASTMISLLKGAGIKTIVLHFNLPDFDEGDTYCDQAVQNIDNFLNVSTLHLQKVYEDENAKVIQLK